MNDLPVTLRIDNDIARLSLNRPSTGNAIDMDMATTLLRHVITCETDENIRCVILDAKGKLFCAGGDVNGMHSAPQGMPAYLSELAGLMHLAISRLVRL